MASSGGGTIDEMQKLRLVHVDMSSPTHRSNHISEETINMQAVKVPHINEPIADKDAALDTSLNDNSTMIRISSPTKDPKDLAHHATGEDSSGADISLLPPEILGLIAEQADPLDLPNMRLTSRDFCAASSKSFGHKRLAHRRFVVSDYSLKALVKMTAHPIFAPCIKSILLSSTSVEGYSSRRFARLLRRELEDFGHDPGYLKITSRRISILAQVLENLSSLPQRIALGTYDDVAERWGLHRKGRRTGFGSGRLRQNKSLQNGIYLSPRQDAFLALIIASRRSGFKLRENAIVFDLAEDMDDRLSIMLRRFLYTDSMGNTLPELDIRINTKVREEIRIRSKGTLRLELYCLKRGQILDSINDFITTTLSMSLGLVTPHIHDLRLESFVLGPDDFTRALATQSQSLRRLELVNIHVFNNPYERSVYYDRFAQFQTILKLVRDSLQLDSFYVHHLTYKTIFSSRLELAGGEPQEWNGTDDIQEGIAILLEQVQGHEETESKLLMHIP